MHPLFSSHRLRYSTGTKFKEINHSKKFRDPSDICAIFLQQAPPLPLSTQVHPHHVPGHSKPPAEGEPAALLLGHDVRVRRRQHATAAGDLLGERPPAGAAALHHDPEQQGRVAAM